MTNKRALPHSVQLLLSLLWRILAACALFLVFYIIKNLGLRIMTSNPYLQNVAGFWYAEKFLRTVFCLSFLAYFSLASVFVLHDLPYRRRFLSAIASGSSFKIKARVILCGTEFWVQEAVIALWVLLSASDIFFFDLVGGFYAELSMTQAHLITIAIMLPSLLLLTLLSHIATINWWARQKQPPDAAKRARLFAFLKQLAFTFILHLLTAFVVPILYPMLDTFGKVIHIHPLIFLIPLCVVFVGIFSYRYLRALLARYLFLRTLKRICHEEKYRLDDGAHIYSSVFSAKDGINFRLSTSQGDYSVKLICSLRRKTPLFLDEEGNVSHTVSYGLFGLDFFTDTISAKYEFEGAGKKILILSPAVNNVYVTDGKARRLLESGDRVMGYWLYDGNLFLNALKRKIL